MSADFVPCRRDVPLATNVHSCTNESAPIVAPGGGGRRSRPRRPGNQNAEDLFVGSDSTIQRGTGMHARRRLRMVFFIAAACATGSAVHVQSASAHKLKSGPPCVHGCQTVERQALRHHLFTAGRATMQSGIASVYSGHNTASGEHMNPSGLTAAHPSLPFGSKVKVTNRHTGQSVVVRINDRGPFVKGRVIDLSPAAARAIGAGGLTQVSLSAN
jgi:rare lipoprotein A